MNDFSKRIAGLSLAESQQVLVEWNQTAHPYPREHCLHELIEEQAERTPNAVAVVSDTQRLTYRELNQRANQLAHHLRTLGVGPETLVGISAARSVETIVEILAVLKAGGAYVPLDPGYPPERLRFMLEDSQAPVLITELHLREHIPAEGLSIVCLDADWSQIATQPETNPAPLATPENLAYVIYTSGSTGKPKGVLVPHRQIVQATSVQFVYDQPSAFLLLLSFSFDASGVGIYWTLCQGGRLVIPTDDQMRDPRLLHQLIEKEQISHLDCAPSLYALIIGADASALGSLRYNIVGGEACSPQLVAHHYHLLPGTRLVNHYGPTEATILSTRFECRQEHSHASSIPIGRPIPNARIYLFDEQFNPVPVGATGEIYIGGEGVTRGYLNQPDLTAERFIPNPFAIEQGERLYKTGDLARYLPDGNIDFLGRVDHQVKVRGYRIELGEIEAALLRHPAVAEVVVEARDDSPGNKRLVAYIVSRSTVAPTRDALIAFLEERLPHYMVPQLVMFLNELPRNLSGKVERRALPAPEVQRPDSESAFVAPRTPLEAGIAQIFAAVLGIDRIGVHDNFFDFGGNSLLVAQLVLHLSGTYSIDLPVVQLFRVPTAAGIAHIIEVYREEGLDGVQADKDALNLEAEIVLDPTITPEGLPMANILNPSCALLTGATGYLGAFLLERLLLETKVDVFCLVRAPGPEEALERIKKTLRSYQIWNDSFSSRIHPVVGDLTKPLLGLSPSQFSELAATIDTIYHSAAVVNFLYPYAALKGSNVFGTQEILRLACQVKVKAVHYVSSIDVFIASHADRPFLEVEQPRQTADLPDGYSQTKWVAEEIVTTARSRGVPICIYRPGLIISHTRTGASQPTNHLLVEIKGFLELGFALGQDLLVNVMPVDYAAQALVHLSRQKESFGKYFHLWNLQPVSVNQIYDWLRSFGYEFEVVPMDIMVQQLVKIDPSHPLFPLIPLFMAPNEPLEFAPQVQNSFDPRIECLDTLKGLEGSGIECPPMTEQLTHLCFSYLIDVGFLERPSARLVANVAAAGSRL